jgi:hypothetical protein
MVSGVTQNLFSVWGNAADDVYAVGSGSVVAHYDGTVWTSTSVAGLVNLWGVWGSAADDVFAVGDSGTILHYNGASWSSMTSGTANQLMGVWGTSSSDVFAVGVGGRILHYDSVGWSAMDSGSTANLRGVWGAAPFDVYAIGDNGLILHYDEDAPIVTSVNPNVGNQGAILSAVIQGVNLSGTTAVNFGSGITVTGYTVNSATQITASITISGSATTGARDVSVTTPVGTAIKTGAFTVNYVPPTMPTISSVSPNNGIQGQSLFVIITGNYLSGATAVSFGSGITVTGYTVNSATQITASITISGSATTGVRDVSVTTPVGTATKVGVFTVNLAAATISSVNPNQGSQGQTLNGVIITGTYFTGATAVSFGSGITVTGYTVNSATQITASISISDSAAAGARDVSVTTPVGTATKTGAFTVNQAVPTISAVSPVSGTQGQSLSVTITGTYLAGATAVGFGSGIVVTGYTVNSATQITASITISGSATAGASNVSVATPGGTDTLEGGFEVVSVPPAGPLVSGVTPGVGSCGEGLEVVISGRNLVGASEVSFGDGIVVSYVVDSPTQITASIAIDSDATIGTRDVVVTTPDGSGVLSAGFEVVAVPLPQPPEVMGVSPATAVCGEELEVVISGTNLGEASEVDFGAGIVVSYVYVGDSETQITAGIVVADDAAIGARDVTVTTAGGTDILAGGFEVVAGSPRPPEVVISGSNLGGASEVSFGDGIVVSYVAESATQITVKIVIAGDAVTGTRDVVVTTPDGNDVLQGGFEVMSESRQGFTPFTPWFWIGIILFGVLVAFFLIATREKKPEAKRWSLLPPSYGG